MNKICQCLTQIITKDINKDKKKPTILGSFCDSKNENLSFPFMYTKFNLFSYTKNNKHNLRILCMCTHVIFENRESKL